MPWKSVKQQEDPTTPSSWIMMTRWVSDHQCLMLDAAAETRLKRVNRCDVLQMHIPAHTVDTAYRNRAARFVHDIRARWHVREDTPCPSVRLCLRYHGWGNDLSSKRKEMFFTCPERETKSASDLHQLNSSVVFQLREEERKDRYYYYSALVRNKVRLVSLS